MSDERRHKRIFSSIKLKISEGNCVSLGKYDMLVN
jgi:hypothetical protein